MKILNKLKDNYQGIIVIGMILTGALMIMSGVAGYPEIQTIW